ncbi:hypothetical protein CPB84DRAFT_1670434 [Gymnopilus junonius]|uniref:Uncharacterized protein n=1 Tax=Gymnopilus junonius TaxID=109634 RepID=A0A9P5TV08_GYMJU|nr:hypothetical protein CPB84DRAFT_1670434 [Gymnopilus junonius]
MSTNAIRCRQTSILKGCSERWHYRRGLHSSYSVSSRSQSRPSPEQQELSSTTQSSLAKELLEVTELTAAETRKKDRQHLFERSQTKNPIENYLGHLQTTKHELKLEDIERYKPPKVANPKSPDYETIYNEVISSLMRSFSQPQLRQFLQLYGLPSPHHRGNKRTFAVKILEEKWGWPSLAKVSQDRIDWSEVSERQFYLDPAQSFLLMGKDGTNLLNLSRQYNVSLSFTANPMSLRVTGLKGSLKQIDAYLQTLKKDIDLDIFPLPFSKTLGPDIAQSISRLAGAYVKILDDVKLSISFLKSQPQTLSIAKQLVTQVSTQVCSVMQSSNWC